MRRSLLALLVAYAALALVGPVSARAATPADRDDPCARAARDVCHTAGTGMYAESRYGARWLGDYRGAVPGAAATFCIDLRFWYAARRYRYVETSAAALRNRDGEPVSLVRREKLAYAIWQYGRSSSPSQQAAVSLYVHALMGDGRPGELDPRLAGSTGSRLYRRIAAAAARRHGPYRIETGVSGSPVVGEPAAVTIRVVSAAGYPLPHVPVTLTAGAAADVVRRVSTDASGVARVSLTPTGPRTLLAVTTRLASPVPRLYAATARAAAANAQRLAVPTSRQVARTLAVPARTRLALSAVAAPERVAVGETTSARVTLAGAAPGWRRGLRVDVTAEQSAAFADAGFELFAGRSKPGAYYCEHFVCALPVQTADELESLLSS
jgi:hypothetical protein